MPSPLIALFGGKTKARILETLLTLPGETFHLRGLALAAGTDSGNTSKLLKVLVGIGLVLASSDRHSTRYSINSSSPLFEPLRQLVARAGALTLDMRDIASTLEASYVGIYGSVATGTDDGRSDVDVLLIGDLSAVAAQTAFKGVGRKHGKTVNVVTVKADELTQKLREGGAFWESVALGKKIDLKGAWTDVAVSKTAAS